MGEEIFNEESLTAAEVLCIWDIMLFIDLYTLYSV